MVRALALELAPQGLTVNALAPGFVPTDATAALHADQKFSERIAGRAPLGRWGEASELVGPAVVLASAAAAYITGHMLTVDGGLTCALSWGAGGTCVAARTCSEMESQPSRLVPRLGGVLETSLYVADLERARAFYQHVFGLEAFFRDSRMCALGVVPGQVLLLFAHGTTGSPAPVPGGFIPPHGAIGAAHLCFAIPAGELTAWEAHLARHGLDIESRIAWQRGSTSLYFRDPDGNSLEVATPGLWPNF